MRLKIGLLMKSKLRIENNFYKIILIGEVSEEFTINEEFLEELLRDEFIQK